LAAPARAQEVVIFSKEGCHLCEVVEAEVRSMKAVKSGLKVVNIDEDSVLYDKYWLRVPVVRIEGKDVFEAKMIDLKGEWKKKLSRLLE